MICERRSAGAGGAREGEVPRDGATRGEEVDEDATPTHVDAFGSVRFGSTVNGSTTCQL